MLLSEYVGDLVLTRGKHTIKSWKESLWKLVDDLTNAFNLPNPLTHKLFKNTKEMNEKDFQILFSSYNEGIEWLNDLLK